MFVFLGCYARLVFFTGKNKNIVEDNVGTSMGEIRLIFILAHQNII